MNRFLCIFKLIKTCKKYDLHRRILSSDMTAQLHAVHIRHFNICHNNIRLTLLYHFQRLDSIIGISDYRKSQLFPINFSDNSLYYFLFIINQKSGQLNFTAGSGLGDWTTNRLASGAIIDRMLSHGNYDMNSSDPQSGVYIKGEDDPRILLNYNPVSITNRQTGQVDEHRYLGTDLTVADELTEYYNAQAQDEVNTANKGFSQITQRGFFWENDKFDMLIMASPEIHFLKAEAYAMGYGVTQDMSKAEEEFKTAVSQSVTLYYYYDSIGSGENCRRYDAPASEEIADFADAKWNSAAYADKLDAIITQKWLHFGFLTSREAWSDIRRTGYPSGLIFPEVSGTIPRVPNRWRYPSTEVNYNPYYKDVADKDTYTEKLFWAK